MSEINTAEFMRSFDEYVNKTQKTADQAMREVGAGIFTGITKAWPVDTARSRGNWQIGIDKQPKNELDTTENPDPRELPKLDGVEGDTEIWFVNNVPYAERLEYGWSQQAPSGAVRITLSRFERILQQAARDNQL